MIALGSKVGTVVIDREIMNKLNVIEYSIFSTLQATSKSKIWEIKIDAALTYPDFIVIIDTEVASCDSLVVTGRKLDSEQNERHLIVS